MVVSTAICTRCGSALSDPKRVDDGMGTCCRLTMCGLLASSPANLWGRSSGVLAGYLWLTPGPTTGQPARGGSVETKRAGCPLITGNRAGNDGGPGALTPGPQRKDDLMYARLYHSRCCYDKHGIERLTEPMREIEERMLTGCPCCDGSGWTFEADPYGDEFYPCPCPLGGQFPTLHNDGRVA